MAFQIALLSSLLPTIILSGFIFPISSMPTVVQAITHIVPARYFLVALRAIVLKGAGIAAFWQDLVALAIFATVALGLASLRLRREWACMRRVLHLMRKELLELRQDPRLFGIVILAPIIQLTVLGYAATTDVKDIPIVIVDADRSTESRELVHRFEASANFKIVGDARLDRRDRSLARSRRSVDGDQHSARLRPQGWRRARPTTLQIVADGTDSNSTGVAMGYAQTLIGGYAQDLRGVRGAGRP